MVTSQQLENAAIGTRIGPVDPARAAYVNTRPHIEASLLDVTFEVITGNSQTRFDIDRISGVLYLVGGLDFEMTSVSVEFYKCFYAQIHELQISKSTLNSGSQLINVCINVDDVNDNAPRFVQDPIIFSVAENVKENSIIWTYNATDADSSAN